MGARGSAARPPGPGPPGGGPRHLKAAPAAGAPAADGRGRASHQKFGVSGTLRRGRLGTRPRRRPRGHGGRVPALRLDPCAPALARDSRSPAAPLAPRPPRRPELGIPRRRAAVRACPGPCRCPRARRLRGDPPTPSPGPLFRPRRLRHGLGPPRTRGCPRRASLPGPGKSCSRERRRRGVVGGGGGWGLGGGGRPPISKVESTWRGERGAPRTGCCCRHRRGSLRLPGDAAPGARLVATRLRAGTSAPRGRARRPRPGPATRRRTGAGPGAARALPPAPAASRRAPCPCPALRRRPARSVLATRSRRRFSSPASRSRIAASPPAAPVPLLSSAAPPPP